MLYIELLAPAGLLDADARAELARRLSARTLLDAGTDPGVLDLFASMSEVVVREPESWYRDGAAVTAEGGPRFLVNVYARAWAKEMAGHLITTVTAELAALAAARGWPEPRTTVHVLAMAGYGADGAALGDAELTELVESARVREPGQAPPGSYIDPVCGALVPAEAAVTVELDGTTYGFCCPGCRGRYVKQRRRDGATA